MKVAYIKDSRSQVITLDFSSGTRVDYDGAIILMRYAVAEIVETKEVENEQTTINQ